MRDETELAIEKMLDLYEQKIRECTDPVKKRKLEKLKEKYAKKFAELKTPTLL